MEKKIYNASTSLVLNVWTAGLLAASSPEKKDEYSSGAQLSRRQGFGDVLWEGEEETEE